MPRGINIGGRLTRIPGVYATPNFEANAGVASTTKTLAIVGDFPFLEQHTPTRVTSLRSMLKLAPASSYLKRAAVCTYQCSNDDRIGAGPSDVVLVNAGACAQASANLVDGVAANSLLIASKAWGYAGNRTSYALTIDATDPTNPLYSFTFGRDGVTESFENLEGISAFSVAYSGNDAFTCLAGFNSSGEFFITASKAAIDIGTFSPACTWDGVVTIDPSGEPGGLETYTVTISGTNKATGSADTAALTWTNGGGHAAKSTTKSFSSITSIVFEQAGGSPTTPTFTVSGDMVRVTSEQFPTVEALTDYLETKSSDLTVSAVHELASTLDFDDLDIKAPASIGSALTFRITVARLVAALEASNLVEVTAVSGGAVPVAGSGMLTGGTESAAAGSDWADALATLTLAYRVRVIAVLSDALVAHTALKTHLNTMWGVGRYEVQGWTGTAAQVTKANAKARALALNSFKLGLVAQEVKITTLAGTQERVAPYWYALMHAAAQCSMGTAVPLTRKRLNIVEVYDGADWTIADDIEELIAAGLTVTAIGLNGLEVVRAVSTHLLDDDDARTAVSAVEGLARYIIRLRTRLETAIGDPAIATTAGRIKSIVETETAEAVADGDGVSGWDPNSVTVEQDGGKWVVGVAVAPVYEITFVDLRPSILPVSFQV